MSTVYVSRRLLALCVVGVLALGIAACGSSSKSSSSSSSSSGAASASSSSSGSGSSSASLTALKAVVAAHTSATKIGPTVPIGKPIPKNKTLVYVNCGAPACLRYETSFEAAAHVLGWKVTVINAMPTPQSVQNAFAQAIRDKPDGVSSAGLGTTLYPEQAAELTKMGIPNMAMTGGQDSGQGGITFDPLGPTQTGTAMKILADKAIVDMGGSGLAGSVLLTGYPIVAQYTKAYTDEITAKCPKCTQAQLTIAPTALGTTAAQSVVNFVRAHPGMKSLYYSYDLAGSGVPAAAKGAGVTMPPTYSWGVDVGGIQALNDGQRTAAMVDPFDEAGWQEVDAFARKFTGRPVSESQPFQNFVIWSKDYNNVPALTSAFPPVVKTYQAQFEKLWGVK